MKEGLVGIAVGSLAVICFIFIYQHYFSSKQSIQNITLPETYSAKDTIITNKLYIEHDKFLEALADWMRENEIATFRLSSVNNITYHICIDGGECNVKGSKSEILNRVNCKLEVFRRLKEQLKECDNK